MKRITVSLISLFLLVQSSLFAYSTNPKNFVDELVNDVISKLSDINLNKEQKETFITEVALQNVDINALGLYTLGELRKSAGETEILDYQNSFKKYYFKIIGLFFK